MIGVLIRLLLPYLIELIGSMEENPECPGGVCSELKTEVELLQADVTGPNAQGIGDLIGCIDWARLIDAIKEVIAVLRDARDKCPPVSETQGD